jgi:phage terminase large subunit
MPENVDIDLRMLPEVSNPAFYPLFLCKDRYMIMFGGAGSGKSYFAVEKILVRILKAMANGKIHKFLCLRKTQPAARKSILSLFQEYITNWGLAGSCKINKTDMTISFLGGCQIIITGMDDKEKIKSIHGITGIWLEESTEFAYDDFKQIDLRLRGKLWDYKQIILTFNPIDEQHWIRQKLFTDELQALIESGTKIVRKEFSQKIEDRTVTYGMTIMHSTYKDNRFIDDEYKAKLEQLVEEDPNYFKIYTLGVWGVLKGLIFEDWKIVKEWPEEFDTGGYGLDFGFSVDPTAVIEARFNGNDLYLREHLYECKLTNRDIAAKLKGITKGEANKMTVADSAEPKSIVEINQYGHTCIPCAKGKDSVIHGIQKIKQFKIHIDYNSPNLVKELQGYKWAENKDGEPKYPRKPVDFNNHLIDATRYVVTKIKGMLVTMDFMDEKEEKHFSDEAPDHDLANPDIDNDEIWDNI